MPDTDWHVDRLYDFADALGAGMLVATHSRYVVDLNRDPEDRPLYPGADNTEVCPTSTFDAARIYQDGGAPDPAEVAARVARYWDPYHAALQRELDGLHERHGVACLLEAHSIRSVVPRFFDGRLPDLNLGTADGASAAPDLTDRAMAALRASDGYSSVLNGRFKGGYNTRRFGAPSRGIHALQLEMAQCVYMDEAPPFTYRPEKADRIRPTLRRLLQAMLDWANRDTVCSP